jgi:hypothetical protein
MAYGNGWRSRRPAKRCRGLLRIDGTAELLGDTERFEQWTAAISVLKASHGFGPLDELRSSTAYGNLSAFCAACCGEMYLFTGD